MGFVPTGQHPPHPQAEQQPAADEVPQNHDSQPPSYIMEDSLRLRIVKAVFDVETTSAKHPVGVVQEITRVLTESFIPFYNPEVTLFQCTHGVGTDTVHWEVEVCIVQNLGLTGVVFKRRAGNFWNYKAIVENLRSRMQL